MKRFYSLFIAMILFTASYAQVVKTKSSAFSSRQKAIPVASRSNEMKKSKFVVNQPTQIKKGYNRANSYDVEGLEMITEQPSGEVTTQVRKSTYYMVFWGDVYYDYNYGSAGKLVKGDDGYYYLSEPFTGLPTGTWLKLEKEDDNTLVAKLPQKVFYEYYGEDEETGEVDDITGYAFAMEEYSFEEDGETWYSFRPVETQEFRFKMNGDSLVAEDPTLLLGMADETGAWQGYGDYNQKMDRFKDTLLTVSDELQAKAEKYALLYEDYTDSRYGYQIDCVFDGQGKIYAKGIFASLPDVWVEGTYDGEKAVFPSGQYMGYNEGYQLYSYFVGAKTIVVEDENYGDSYEDYGLLDNITFYVDPDTKTLSSDGQHIVLNGNKGDYLNYIETINYPELQPYEEKAGVPQDPEFIYVTPYDEEWGYCNASTYLPILDSSGHLMDADKVTYKYYIDDDEFVFEPGDYYVAESLVDVPYNYWDQAPYYNDLYNDGGMHYVYFYFTGFDKMGIQITYNGGGETHSSDIIYYDMTDESSVQRVDSPANVKSISYTDITGRCVSQPHKGIYVKTITYMDGTQKSTKEVK